MGALPFLFFLMIPGKYDEGMNEIFRIIKNPGYNEVLHMQYEVSFGHEVASL